MKKILKAVWQAVMSWIPYSPQWVWQRGYKTAIKELTLLNKDRAVEYVDHQDLERVGDSAFKSECPFCNHGILLMRRDDQFRLLKFDSCCLCAQKVYYNDDEVGSSTLHNEEVSAE